MFDEIPVLVSCWKKTYAHHMLYRNISSNVFHFLRFFLGFLPLVDSTAEVDVKHKERGDGHATKVSGRLKPRTIQLQDVCHSTTGPLGHSSPDVSGTIIYSQVTFHLTYLEI